MKKRINYFIFSLLLVSLISQKNLIGQSIGCPILNLGHIGDGTNLNECHAPPWNFSYTISVSLFESETNWAPVDPIIGAVVTDWDGVSPITSSNIVTSGVFPPFVFNQDNTNILEDCYDTEECDQYFIHESTISLNIDMVQLGICDDLPGDAVDFSNSIFNFKFVLLSSDDESGNYLPYPITETYWPYCIFEDAYLENIINGYFSNNINYWVCCSGLGNNTHGGTPTQPRSNDNQLESQNAFSKSVVFPNPSHLSTKILTKNLAKKIQFMTLTGDIFSEQVIKLNNDQEIIVDTKSWSNGIYLARIYYFNGESEVLKIIKQ